jgi:peptide/nickel transport system permease protein
VPVLFLVTVFTFLLVHLIPGDAAEYMAGDEATVQDVARIREELGLDDPLVGQYLEWVSNVALGDFGTSMLSSQDVAEMVTSRLPVTLSLAVGGVIVALVIGVTTGVAGAVRPGSLLDRAATVFASLGLAVPNFWFALVLVYVFALTLTWFPATGYTPLTESPIGWLASIALPCIALGTSASASISRQTRSALIDVLGKEYVRTARAAGVSRRVVVGKYGLKNAAIPVITVLGFQLSGLFAGALIVEQVFALPGLGSLAVSAVRTRDIPMIQGIVLYITVVVIFVNLAIDVAYGLLNPKVRSE